MPSKQNYGPLWEVALGSAHSEIIAALYFRCNAFRCGEKAQTLFPRSSAHTICLPWNGIFWQRGWLLDKRECKEYNCPRSYLKMGLGLFEPTSSSLQNQVQLYCHSQTNEQMKPKTQIPQKTWKTNPNIYLYLSLYISQKLLFLLLCCVHTDFISKMGQEKKRKKKQILLHRNRDTVSWEHTLL